MLRVVVTKCDLIHNAMEGGKLHIGLDLYHNSADDQAGRILNRFGLGLLQVCNNGRCNVVIALTNFP